SLRLSFLHFFLCEPHNPGNIFSGIIKLPSPGYSTRCPASTKTALINKSIAGKTYRLVHQPSTINDQRSTVNRQPSTVNPFPLHQHINLIHIFPVVAEPWNLVLSAQFALAAQPAAEQPLGNRPDQGGSQCNILVTLGFI